MTARSHIKLTMTDIVLLDPKTGQTMQQHLAQPVEIMLDLASCTFVQVPNQPGACEVLRPGAPTLRVAEHWLDIVEKIEPLVVVRRDLISQAAQVVGQFAVGKVYPDGELPVPASQPTVGDVSVIELPNGDHVVEICCSVMDGQDGEWMWSRVGVPPELMSAFPTREAAESAVRIAGYGRRLRQRAG